MLICDARPCARGRNRFNVVPSFTYASLTYNELISKFKLCSAFAIADFKTFSTTGDAALGVCFKIAYASPTCFPQIKSITKRALRGAMRTVLAIALASIAMSSSQY